MSIDGYPNLECVQNLTIVRLWSSRSAPLREVFGAILPGAGRSVATEYGDIVWRSPSVWWLKSRSQSPAALVERLGRSHGVIDISDGTATFSLSGPMARTVLASGCSIDLHPQCFSAGSVAATRYDVVEAVLHAHSEGRFDLHIPRSYADEAEHALARAFARSR